MKYNLRYMERRFEQEMNAAERAACKAAAIAHYDLATRYALQAWHAEHGASSLPSAPSSEGALSQSSS
jgi:hypothetical protein